MSSEGGRVARRAVRRWSWRLFRREWRQQLLVLGLVSFAVAAAVFGATAAYNMTSSRTADFGSADHRFELAVTHPNSLPAYLEDASDWFGTIEVIGHWQVLVPGSAEAVELRALEDDGPYSGPMVGVLDGRRPTTSTEVAVTDGVASTLGIGVGDTIDLRGATVSVVGIVENPHDLGDEFVDVLPSAAAPESITLLVRADGDRAFAFRPSEEPGPGFFESADASEQVTAAVAVFVVSSVAMVLVCLVAGASFATLAHRRLRQLGMLAAVGGTPRQLRRAMVGNGTAVGVVAAGLGVALGLLGWVVAAPALEPAAAHRIDRWNIPLWLPIGGAVLAVATATVAAWWPARAVSRIPITAAVAARPPAPRSVHRSLVVGLALFAVGIAAIATGIDTRADTVTPYLFIPGVIAIVAAVLSCAAPILRGAARISGGLPVGTRLAVRDLARFEARSSAALGAISLGLAIAVSVVVVAAADVPGADEGNLADDQLVIWTTSPNEFGGLQLPVLDAADARQQTQDLDRIVDSLPGTTVVPLVVAVDPTNPETRGGRPLLSTAVLGRPVDENTLRDSGLVFVATPDLLDYLEVERGAVGDDTLLLTQEAGDVYITGNITSSAFRRAPVPAPQVAALAGPDHSSAPRTLITAAGMEAAGLEPLHAGWLLDLEEPIAAAALADAREIAAGSGLAIETRDPESGLSVVRAVATAAGVVVALAILAMTAGLLRGEAAQDLRTLEAAGASRRTRRAIAASTCGVLALVGGGLATVASYAALVAGYWPETDRLGNVPLDNLLTMAVGLPLLSAALAWVWGGRLRAPQDRAA